MRITKEAVIQAASEVADQEGFYNVSLKVVAHKLNIRTPSLYNHIANSDDLLRKVAHQGMNTLNEQMTQAAIGVSGDEAIQSICNAYFSYMIAHPGIYETIQWAVWHGNGETEKLFSEYRSLFAILIRSCNLKEEKTDEILDLLIGILHGYTTMHLRQALESNQEEAMLQLSAAIDTVLCGIHKKYTV